MCNNILVRGVNWIGDAVMTMPALRALRQSRPDAHITLLVTPWVAPLFEKDPHIDKIMLYEDEHRSLSGKLRLAKVLRKNNFCSAVLFQNAIDAALISFLAGIPERIGYNRDSRRMLLSKAIRFDDHAKGLHHIEYYLNLLKNAGFDARYSLPWIYLTLEERLNARNRVKELNRPLVALNPGATYGSSKRWHTERFAELARMIAHKLNGSVVILGGHSETGIADEIVNYIQNVELLNLAGKTVLRELAAVLSEVDLLVTNDSGPMHIGYAVGTPVVALFGSTSPELTGPAGKDAVVVKKDVYCAPCFERECRQMDLECMDLITPEEVFDALGKVLHSRRAVFFDRDGTLCRDADFLSRMEDFEVFPDIDTLLRLKERGFRLLGLTNQSGIARGLVQEDFVRKVNSIFLQKYHFDGFYYCPHLPDEHCSCRKPEPGMIYEARADHDVDLKRSFVVGDKESDMILAKSVGATGILVTTGKDRFSSYADYVAGTIKDAVGIISDEDFK